VNLFYYVHSFSISPQYPDCMPQVNTVTHEWRCVIQSRCGHVCEHLHLSSCDELDGKIEQGKEKNRPALGFHYCAPLSMEGPCHVTEPLPCGGSGSLAALQPTDSLSPCLQWLPAHQFIFNYLTSQTHSEEVQKQSIKTFWRFLSLNPPLWSPREIHTNLSLWHPSLCKVPDYETVLHPILSSLWVSIFTFASQDCLSSLWLDGHYVALKEECWSETCTLIYDVICNLTFLPQCYCQGAMVIRQHIQFSQSGLRRSTISDYYQTSSNRHLHLLRFMHPLVFQLCRICRW